MTSAAEAAGADTSERRGAACPECGGRGWIAVDDDGAGSARPCTCRDADLGARRLREAGVPARYADCRLDNFNTRAAADGAIRDALFEAHRLSTLYVDRFVDLATGGFRESGLVYIGPPGGGKTHLATSVLAEVVLRYGVRGRFVDFTHLLHEIRSTFDANAGGTPAQILDPIVNADLLVLDELGAQKPTEWVMDTLYLIINSRYTHRLPTIFTTNYRLSETGSGDGTREDRARFERLASRISPLLVSRICEMAQPVRLDVWDFRREVKMHHHGSDQ